MKLGALDQFSGLLRDYFECSIVAVKSATIIYCMCRDLRSAHFSQRKESILHVTRNNTIFSAKKRPDA